MSVRKEDKKKTECPSRDYGMSAAAVIGVGIGAALCYYLNKRARNPDSTGATTSGWTCEGPVPSSSNNNNFEETNSYTTISIHSTTDTSINSISGTSSTSWNFSDSENHNEDTANDSIVSDNNYLNDSVVSDSYLSASEIDSTASEDDISDSENDIVVSEDNISASENDSIEVENYFTYSENGSILSEDDSADPEVESANLSDFTDNENNNSASEDVSHYDDVSSDTLNPGTSTGLTLNYATQINVPGEGYRINSLETVLQTPVQGVRDNEESDYDTDGDWDVINQSSDIPSGQQRSNIEMLFYKYVCHWKPGQREEDRSKERRVRAFNERSWSLEECSICFDVMLINQELMSLPCSHFFHTQCLLPWLHEQQTCPNCRKKA